MTTWNVGKYIRGYNHAEGLCSWFNALCHSRAVNDPRFIHSFVHRDNNPAAVFARLLWRSKAILFVKGGGKLRGAWYWEAEWAREQLSFFIYSNQVCCDRAPWLILNMPRELNLNYCKGGAGCELGSDQGNEFSVTASSKSLNPFEFILKIPELRDSTFISGLIKHQPHFFWKCKLVSWNMFITG